MLTIRLLSDQTDRGRPEWFRLYSPIVDVDGPRCLTFYYYNRFVDIELFGYDEDVSNHIATIAMDGLVSQWQYAMFDVVRGRKGIIYQMKHRVWRQKNFAIDEIVFHEGTCDELGNGNSNI